MSRGKLSITWDEISSAKVDQKLREREYLARTGQHYEHPTEPVIGANVRSRSSIWHNTIVYMTLFGMLGGLLGWGFGEVMHLRPNARSEARELLAAYQQLSELAARSQMDTRVRRSLSELRQAGCDNPYFAVVINNRFDEQEKAQRLAAIEARDAWKDFIANVLFFGISGLIIGTCLGIAEPVVDRNMTGAVTTGALAAGVGLCGGIVVSTFFEPLQAVVAGGVGDTVHLLRKMLAGAISWGVLGLFLAATPGLVLRNRKKLLIGMTGGLIGGIIGGLLFDPIAHLVESKHASRLIAMLCIGMIAGLATGALENAVKTGWFKVLDGLIAGKQFVLYRNPTYIGSSPQSHIYLFKDAGVGRRHAAVHIIPGGYEIEDLPLGERTLVNDKAITRARLGNGDRIRIGRTTFLFQVKEKKQ
jgi:hypothetical protein